MRPAPVRADAPPQRIAVVVGANAAAPGRKPLRYSQRDAQAFSDVLVELGGFSAGDVHVLLDPEPSQVLATLDTVLANVRGEALVLFYYSGHADTTALYPRGRPLSFASLRERLQAARASVRIGIIDACSGGGWTGTKGLKEVEPFEVSLPNLLDNEGSVLIASSSGLEDAHESESIGGSFFTHYWNAGLRGAADTDDNGRVTLTEAFDYAKALTIRDSALYTGSAQHPSFAMNLHGRQDLTLAQLSAADAVLTVEQHTGPLELLHLDSGVIVLELPKGERSVRLAVAPGRYLLRRREAKQTFARELRVRAGQTTHVDEAGLSLLGEPGMAIKSALPPSVTRTTLPAGYQEISAQVGIEHGHATDSSLGIKVGGGQDGELGMTLSMPRGLTDRLQWNIPSLSIAYRFGDRGGAEWIPWGGLLGWGIGFSSANGTMIVGQPGLGLDLRLWTGPRSSLDVGSRLTSQFRWNAHDPDYASSATASTAPSTWRAGLSLGYTYTLADLVTFHVAVDYSQYVLHHGEPPRYAASSEKADMALTFGSAQSLAQRRLPLVRVHFNDVFSLDLDIRLRYRFQRAALEDSYLLGFSCVW